MYSKIYGAAVFCSIMTLCGGEMQAQNAQNAAGGQAEENARSEQNNWGKAAWDRSQQYWAGHITLSGSLRARWESTQGADFSTTPSDAYGLTRVRLTMKYEPVSWLSFLGEAQDSRVMGYKTIPSSSYANPFDLRQVFVQLGANEGPVMFRAGRQELTLGSGRMIASPDWGNVPKTFDILRGAIRAGGVNVDIAAGSAVLNDPKRMDRHKPGEHFYAAYSTLTRLLPGGTVEPYFIAKTQIGAKGKDNKIGDADTYATGMRITQKFDKGFDFSAEAVHETGSYANDAVRAWGTTILGGYTAAHLPMKPRFVAEYVFASGDSGRKDGAHQSFDYMYGLNQPMNSYTGQFAWRNLKDLRAGVVLQITKNLKTTIDYRDYWLATTQDGLYNATGTRTVFNTAATSSHVANGVETNFTYAVAKNTTCGIGVANLFPGEYLKQSKKTTGFVYPFLYFSQRF